jgi:NADH:ubiquinone oxidoreductase subunit K
MKQFGLLFGLYLRPLRTMARILDEGSPIFGALAVLAISALFEVAPFAAALTGAATEAPRPVTAAASGADDGQGDEVEFEEESGPANPFAVIGNVVSTGPLGTLVGLTVLYAPAALFAATLLASIGGFGVAFRRDFGGLVTTIYFIWSAAHLPFVAIAAATHQAFLARMVAAGAFALFLAPGIQLAVGAPLGASFGAAFAGFLGLLFTPFLHILASPFLLFYGWAFLSGNLADVEWGLKARRNLRRYLEAATLNPRDAEAHIQLGLIHLRRQQWPEARARFERAVEIEPTDPDARFQLGRLDRLDGRHAEAEKHFLAVMARDPRFSRHEVWREFGANYLAAKLYEDARKALEHFASQRSHDPEGLVYLGEALRALGRNDEAKARFREAVEAAETMPHYRRHEVSEWKKRAARQITG